MRALIVRLSSLGDVVLATAALEALAGERPDVEVEVLTRPAFAGLLQGHPVPRAVHTWAPGEGVREVARRVRAGRYDRVVDLQGNGRSFALQALTPGIRWLRWRKQALRRRLAARLRDRRWLGGEDVVARYLAALRPLGVVGSHWRPRLHPSAADRARAAELLGDTANVAPLALAPGARWATKAWPAGRWVELLHGWSAAGGGAAVLIGGAEDGELCAGILARAGTPGVILAGRTTPGETAAVLQSCRVLVGNDSAPLHLAGAVGTPVVALFGPTVTGFGFAPRGPADAVVEVDLPCRPCHVHGSDRCPEGHHRCLGDLAADAVLDRVRGVLGAGSGLRGEAGGR